jgi:DNA polymerase (family 10)
MSSALQRLVVSELEKLAFYLDMQGENTFRIRAMQKAAGLLGDLSKDEFQRRLKEKTFGELKGIGKGMLAYFEEIQTLGKLKELEKLQEKLPESLLELRALPGLGPKKIRSLFDLIQVSSLAELEYACFENRLVDIKGFGEKTQDKLLKAIARLRAHAHLFLGATAEEDAAALVKELQKLKKTPTLCGALRRAAEVVDRIEFLLLGKDAEVEAIRRKFSKSESGIPVEFHAASDTSAFAFELFYRTGSEEHIKQVSSHAENAGFVLSPEGLFRKGNREPLTFKQESDVYNALRLHCVPPELREGWDEVVPLDKPSPVAKDLLTQDDVKGAFHNHTTESDGANSLEEMVAHAVALGWKWIGISDHSTSAFYARGLDAKRLKAQHEEIKKIRKKYSSIQILHGVESDILPDGKLDYSNDVLKQLDFVIASVHSTLNQNREDMTARICRALAHPSTTILGHPTQRLLLGRSGYEIDWDQVIKTASENGKAIELNANPHRLDVDWRTLRKNKNLKISINPDAHSTLGLEDLRFGVGIARKGNVSRRNLLVPSAL